MNVNVNVWAGPFKHQCFKSNGGSYWKPVEGMQQWGDLVELGDKSIKSTPLLIIQLLVVCSKL